MGASIDLISDVFFDQIDGKYQSICGGILGGKAKMMFIPCADSSFRRTRYYCCFDQMCWDYYERQKAQCRETYDSRDGTTCESKPVACPC